ncbi:helix-turn-helix domain-containing protein [Methylobacterium nonmethylotrophicum]|nr:AraC family transcriptional regulator [Methylobacterium nonmethylotrophicum]
MRCALSPVVRWELPHPEDHADFSAVFEADHFGGMHLGGALAPRSDCLRTPGVIAAAGLDDIMLMTYLRNGYACEVEGKTLAIQPGDVVVLDLTRPFAVRAPAVSNLSLTIRRDLVTPLVARSDALHGLMLRRGTGMADLLWSHLTMLRADAPAMSRAEADAATAASAALIAGAAGPSREGRALARAALRAGQLRMIQAAIARDVADPQLGPALLARRFRLSRASLYRLFEPVGGVAEAITRARLARARALLEDPGQDRLLIRDIARACGFVNDSAFSRLFRAVYGVGPRDLRRLAAQARSRTNGDPAAPDTDVRVVREWLLSL